MAVEPIHFELLEQLKASPSFEVFALRGARHFDGDSVLFSDGHAATFKASDPSLMTYNPHANQAWEDVTRE
jgi:hypothetical protein